MTYKIEKGAQVLWYVLMMGYLKRSIGWRDAVIETDSTQAKMMIDEYV